MNRKKRNVVIALMVVTFLAAFEGTVVTTAMPTIANSLGRYDLISWIFSAYLLSSAISTPIYGKLSDLFGRKKILSIGIIIFLIGSTLCGLSSTMPSLIAFRAIQGLGAGAILTITFTIIGDIFCVSEKAKIQGLLSTVWGIAGLIGPLIGGFILDNFSWHWIFFVNIPFGLLAIILLNKNLDEIISDTKPSIDYLGAATLTISIVTLLFAFFNNSMVISIVCIIISLISFIGFYFVEKKAIDPIVPFKIFTKTTIFSNIICFIIAAVLIGIESFSPLYTQNVLGFSATYSGLFMAPMSVTWLLSAFILSKTLPKYGEKKIIQASLLVLLFSTIIISFLGVSTPAIYLIIAIFIMGLGFGGVFNSSIIVVQDAVSPSDRGVSTSTNTLIRTIGQTIGVSAFGGILNAGITKYFISINIDGITPDNIYSAQTEYNLSNLHIKEAFFTGLNNIFTVLIFLVLICLVFSFFMPSKSTVLKD